MQQQALTRSEKYGKATRQTQFLAEVNRVVRWAELCGVIDPRYPTGSMVDGEAMYDSAAMRGFADIDPGPEAARNEATVCKFRHLLERHKRGKKDLATVNDRLKRNGIKISNGTIVDAMIISAPSSTENREMSLPGVGDEPAPTRGHRRARRSVHGPATAAATAGVVSVEAAK